jgi:hypothetical protein
MISIIVQSPSPCLTEDRRPNIQVRYHRGMQINSAQKFSKHSLRLGLLQSLGLKEALGCWRGLGSHDHQLL